MKSYIDVSFTLEDDLSHWTNEEKDWIVKNANKVKKEFINEFNNKFAEYIDDVKNLNIAVTFEERE